MTNIILDLKKDNMAFATVNREAQASKNLIDGIKNLGGIVMPGLVISSKLMLDLGYKLFDPITSEEITDENVNKYPWTMADGQTRYLAAKQINKAAEIEAAKLSAKQNDSDVENEENTIFTVDTMSVFEYSGPAEKINDLIIILNNTGKAWSAKDYTHNKFVAYSDRPFLNVTYRLMQQHFTISTVSRIIAGKVGKVKKDSIVKYNGTSRTLDSIIPHEGVELLCLLIKAGFSKDYLQKRYIWDIYSDLSDDDKVKFLNYLVFFVSEKNLHLEDIKTIKEYKEDADSILNYLEKTYPYDSIDVKSKSEIIELSDEKLEKNLCFIENAYNLINTKSEKKNSKSTKKTAKSTDFSKTSTEELVDASVTSIVETPDSDTSLTNLTDEVSVKQSVSATKAEESSEKSNISDIVTEELPSNSECDENTNVEEVPAPTIAEEQTATDDAATLESSAYNDGDDINEDSNVDCIDVENIDAESDIAETEENTECHSISDDNENTDSFFED